MNRNSFLRAAYWFGSFAAVIALVVSFTLGLSVWLMLFGVTSAGRGQAVWTWFLVVVAPVLAAGVLGGSLGDRLFRAPAPSRLEAAFRGALIGGIAAFILFLGFEYDVAKHDYSKAVETSAERGHAANRGVFAVVGPVCALLGAVRALRALKRNAANPQES